jgi:hypothetical protein
VSDLHFPLALLAYGSGEHWARTRGDAILAWACHSRGLAKLAEPEVDECVISQKCNAEIWSQVDNVKEELHDNAVAWAAGSASGWRILTFDTHRKTLNGANSFVIDIQKAAGNSPFVRVPDQFAAEAFGWGATPPGMTYREFSVLCAVYSCIGDKPVAIVRREQVRLRQTGAWNENSQAKLERPRGPEGGFFDTPKPNVPLPLLSLDQIRYVLDKLEGRGLFYRVTAPNKRDTYFSRHHKGKDLVGLVHQKVKQRHAHARKAEKAKTQAMLDAAFDSSAD